MNDTTAQRLAQPLDAKRIKQRAAGGNRPALSYLETHDVIRTANDIFGFGGWGHEIVDLRLIPPVTVHNSDQKPGISVGYVCVVRLSVDGCEPTSGVGFGDATEYRESAGVTAHELAAKEAESDALKRALKNFGDQFGLALYSKDAAKDGHVTNKPAANTPSPAGPDPAAGGTSTPPAAASLEDMAAYLTLAGEVKDMDATFDLDGALEWAKGKDAGKLATASERLRERLAAAVSAAA